MRTTFYAAHAFSLKASTKLNVLDVGGERRMCSTIVYKKEFLV